ncbi:GNAT family N-acetyltransferase [Hymenobacter sp. BT491]|uniref:GNAT family N-acetyltransferase n=1 Tax=Hymenobacter sp. BT491 TaxID=2766779 RepID=UPI001653DBB0|nr:GNAT family N-acetyltransferase [Hymenobacter sp. BT491]MBC6990768.1 GNAT family N-acetyltransferase [Hymenobacter sp. BT491]
MHLLIKSIKADATYDLRHSVLWPDKPRSYVMIAEDAEGHHYGAFRGEELVSVISLFLEGDEARFRKFATQPDCQRQGIGSALLTHTMQEARRLGARTIWCDARAEAAAFYHRFGMAVEGERFYKGPIPYVRMRKGLP